MVVRNVGPDMALVDAVATLPMGATVGATYRWVNSKVILTVAGDYEVPWYESQKVRAGGKVVYGPISLRCGYRRVLSDYSEDEAHTGLTAGFGVSYKFIRLDISYASLGGGLGSNTIAGVSIEL